MYGERIIKTKVKYTIPLAINELRRITIVMKSIFSRLHAKKERRKATGGFGTKLLVGNCVNYILFISAVSQENLSL